MKLPLFCMSVFIVGFVHSLSPSHWLPVLLMSKSKKWDLRQSLLGATVAASGHIGLSLLLGLSSYFLGQRLNFLQVYHNQIEGLASLVLMAFGVSYALFFYFRHSDCSGHTHHGPIPRNNTNAFLFLFSVGLSPCFAVLPVFATAITFGFLGLSLCFLVFTIGVLGAFLMTVSLGYFGLLKLDHPLLEHFGDVITGSCVALMGLVLFVVHQMGWH